MKKIYSIVLMATALLIGTNAWASHDRAWLQAQFDAVAANGQTATITLDDDVILDGPVYLGTENITAQRKSITLDMYGHYIQMSGFSDKWNFMFVVTHGELFVTNSKKDTQLSEIRLVGTTKAGNANSSIFSVYGSYKSSRWIEDGSTLQTDSTKIINTRDNGYFSHLVIGEGVHVFSSDQSFCTGITIDALHASDGQQITYISNTRADYPAYRTDLIAAQAGFAYGVKVEVYGNITIAGTATSGIKSYCIKSNGNLKSPLKAEDISTADYLSDLKNNDSYLTNYVAADHKGDTIDAPFVYVDKDAHLIASSKVEKAAAVYCSGYGKWLIEGECKGNIGVYAKSGKVDINDAKIESTATTYVAPTSGNGVSGSGSAIVVNSTGGSYDGYIDVNISGDTKVKASAGYAIEETVTAKDKQTRVEGISIEGGSFQGGENPTTHEAQPAIIVASSSTNVTVYGGNVQGSLVSKDDETVNILDNKVASDAHITVVTLDDGTKVSVVSEGQAPIEANSVVAAAANSSINWKNTGTKEETLDKDLTLAELEINQTYDQKLTIATGHTLKVGRVVLGPKAQIVVEAGAKFIVTGEQGIVAPVAENIVLKTSETAQATFLFNPEVQSNRHPMATVELISRAYRKENGQYVFQRFGVPSYADTVHRSSVSYTVPTAIYRYDYEAQDWASMAKTEQFVPFQCYEMTTQQATANYVYTFKCPLVGNDNAELKIEDKWNYYANSYVAPINIKQLVSRLLSSNADAVDATIYLHQQEANWWMPVNKGMYLLPTSTAPKEIVPMQAFITKRVGSGASPVINYKEQIWTPIMDPSHTAFAPARNQQVVGTAVVEISDANGIKDEVTLLESDQFSADYDRSYDAEKYINTNSFNLFANENENQMAILATDNLSGTILSMTTKAQTTFTMTFSNVSNMDYAIRDMLTGTEVEIVEGATYMFSVPANASVAGRFQVVEPKKLPTAIEDVEENAAVKGIYTLTGQYVGNDYHNLPAGVYVVNGKKIVK